MECERKKSDVVSWEIGRRDLGLSRERVEEGEMIRGEKKRE